MTDYEKLRDRAVAEYVNDLRQQFSGELLASIHKAMPDATYENPFVEIPADLQAHMSALTNAFANKATRKATEELDNHMYRSMLEWLRKKKV